MSNKTSRIERLYEALVKGDELTVKQIQKRFKLANPTSAISKLRQEVSVFGAKIFLNDRGNVRKYRYWEPTA